MRRSEADRCFDGLVAGVDDEVEVGEGELAADEAELVACVGVSRGGELQGREDSGLESLAQLGRIRDQDEGFVEAPQVR